MRRAIQYFWRHFSGAVVVGIQEYQNGAATIALLKLLAPELYRSLKVTRGTYSALWESKWLQYVEFVNFKHFVREATKQYRDGGCVAMPLNYCVYR